MAIAPEGPPRYRGVSVPLTIQADWDSPRAEAWKRGVDDAVNHYSAGRLRGEEVDAGRGDNDTVDEALVASRGAIRFLYWLQRKKRYHIGGHQKPDDWMTNTLRPVTTPAVELIAEFLGNDVPFERLGGDDREKLVALFPVDDERRELVRAEHEALRRGEISPDEFHRRKAEILAWETPAQGSK